MRYSRFVLLLAISICFQTASLAQAQSKTEILLVGFDHLGQLDNGSASSNVFSPKKQQEIQALVDKLEGFVPELIMVEKEPKEQTELDSLFALYRTGRLKLSDIEYGSSETYQVGFRLAHSLNLETVYGIDHYESTSQSLLDSGDHIALFKEGLTELMQIARPLKKAVQQDSLSIYEYIRLMNQPKLIELTHRLIFNLPAYVTNGTFSKNGTNTVDIGKIDERYIGAEYITLFYNRNLKIYSNILSTQMAKQPKKILLIMGQLHIGVLKDLLEENPNFSIADITDYLN